MNDKTFKAPKKLGFFDPSTSSDVLPSQYCNGEPRAAHSIVAHPIQGWLARWLSAIVELQSEKASACVLFVLRQTLYEEAGFEISLPSGVCRLRKGGCS